jgi:transcription antitermination factor NusG
MKKVRSQTPPMIPPGYESVREFEGHWYVAHTKARFEKAFACDLLNKDIAYFLPMKEKVYVSSGKKRRSILPLFTSYVFFCSDDPEVKTNVYRTNRIASIISVVESERFVDQLAAVESALKNDIELSIIDRIPVGESCRVTSGAMMGTEGTVIGYSSGMAKIVLEVDVLGKGVEMELESSMVEKI